MGKKAIRKENVEVRWFIDDKFDGVRLEKNRHIFVDKEGHEYITGFGRVQRDEKGVLYAERRCKTIKPINIFDVVKRVKETGGSIVILPSE